jgi:hypothetical protein
MSASQEVSEEEYDRTNSPPSTAADGSFCVPVTPDDDWRVSTYFDDGAEAFGLEVALDSGEAAGVCGGSGCKQLGDVALPRLN